jgi:hypothetical protein
MGGIKGSNLVLAFLLEMCLLVIFGYWGFVSNHLLILQLAAGIGLPLLTAVAWGMFLAPKSSRRLKEPWLLITKIIIFGLAVAALNIAGYPLLAGMFGLLSAINLFLITFWRQ